MNSRVVKITVSLLLTVSLLCCSVSVFAENGAEVVQAKETLYCYYIWQFLQAIGINVTYRQVLEYNDFIQDTIVQWVTEYIADLIEADSQPSNFTISQWIAPWQASYDYWGNLRYNSTMLEDMEDFAEWLESKFSLIDDSSVTIDSVMAISGYQIYEFNKFYNGYWDNGTPGVPYNTWMALTLETINNESYPNNQNIIGWNVIYRTDDKDYQYVIYITDNTGNINFRAVTLSPDNTINQQFTAEWGTNGWKADNEHEFYWKEAGGWLPVSGVWEGGIKYHFIPSYDVMMGTLSEISNRINNSDIEEMGDIKILTANIQMPSEDANYTPGDGVTIIDGVPQYEVIEFSGEITNLPAIVSTGTIENPEVDQIYTNIPAFFQMAGDTMNGFKQILFRMPDEVLIAIYAVLSVGVIFGFLRIMREH